MLISVQAIPNLTLEYFHIVYSNVHIVITMQSN